MLDSISEHHMRSSNCPRDVYGNENTRCWNPILHGWVEQSDCRASLLFPREYYSERKVVFSPRCIKDVLLDVPPINGLFLHKSIEQVMIHGIIPMAPDMDIYPDDETTIPVGNGHKAELRQERAQILKGWDDNRIREYKIVLLVRKHGMASTPQIINDGRTILRLNQLHNHNLVFLKSHRLKS